MTREEFVEILETLRRNDAEGLHVEAKSASRALPRRLWETLSAFANSAGGGVILLGINEEAGFRPDGVDDAAKVHDDLASICDEMEPPLRPLIGVFEVEGHRVIVAEIPELVGGRKPCYYRGAGLINGAFVRVADGNRKLSPYEVQSMLSARGQPRDDVEPVAGPTAADLSERRLGPFLERLRGREPFRGWDQERILRLTRVLVEGPDGRLVPSLAGWLCFADYPQEIFPNLCVTFIRYPASRAGELGPRGERFLDNEKVEGPIPEMVLRTLAVAERNMQKRGIVQGLFREDVWEYPEEVLRESIVNALGHRDLSPQARGAQVQVQMYPDRLEVVSPGGLFGPIQPDQLGSPGVQSLRNEFLMKILEDLPPLGERRTLCENRGSGLVAMLARLRGAGMLPPKIEASLTRFKLVVPNYTLVDADTLRAPAAAAPAGRKRRHETERRRQIRELLQEGGDLSAREIASGVGIAPPTVRPLLHKMQADGEVEPTAGFRQSRHMRYRLADRTG